MRFESGVAEISAKQQNLFIVMKPNLPINLLCLLINGVIDIAEGK